MNVSEARGEKRKLFPMFLENIGFPFDHQAKM
jgi:hypothetical protein